MPPNDTFFFIGLTPGKLFRGYERSLPGVCTLPGATSDSTIITKPSLCLKFQDLFLVCCSVARGRDP